MRYIIIAFAVILSQINSAAYAGNPLGFTPLVNEISF